MGYMLEIKLIPFKEIQDDSLYNSVLKIFRKYKLTVTFYDSEQIK